MLVEPSVSYVDFRMLTIRKPKTIKIQQVNRFEFIEHFMWLFIKKKIKSNQIQTSIKYLQGRTFNINCSIQWLPRKDQAHGRTTPVDYKKNLNK